MKKSIYFVLHTLSIGGAERHASSIANYLANNGYSVKIVLLDNDIVSYDLSKGIEVVSLPDSSMSFREKKTEIVKDKTILKICKFFFREKYRYFDRLIFYKWSFSNKLAGYFKSQPGIENSIVISFMPTPNISCSIAKEKCSFKLIMGEFNSPHLEFTPDAPENRIKRKYYPNAEGFVFQTEEQKSFYDYLTKIKMKIIPNPIEKIKTDPFYGNRRKVIVNFCRLAKAKNIPLLIDAFTKIVHDYPDFKLEIYGDGPEKEKIKKQIALNGINDHVEIKPFASNVLDLVSDCAMFVSSSDREGISNSMLEAMAIGLPTVCTDCPAGGARMFIEPYKNGLLVPVKDTDALYEAIKYMIEHPDEAENMGRNAVSIKEILNKDKILKQWMEFVESI